MKITARIVISFVALLLSVASQAQTYPNKTVRIIVPFASGGPTDAMARILAQKFTESMGQSFVVENRAGAGGNIGMGMGAKAAPDGYTLTMVSSSFVVNPSLYSSVPYDAYKDFLPISLAGASPNLVVVHPSVPAKTIQELIALIRTKASCVIIKTLILFLFTPIKFALCPGPCLICLYSSSSVSPNILFAKLGGDST
jgi:tripartite-type tricarboxylate transporter receptor subunit TctC